MILLEYSSYFVDSEIMYDSFSVKSLSQDKFIKHLLKVSIFIRTQ